MQFKMIDEDSDDEIPMLQDFDELVAAAAANEGEPIAIINDDDDEYEIIPKLQNLNNDAPTATAPALAVESKNDGANSNRHRHLPPVPVTILSGFLGSGKTTLVRHILTSNQHNKRIAVIENEFGGGESDVQLAQRLGLNVTDTSTLSVETMIAKDGTDGMMTNLADFIELPNGCVCCTVKDSLVETLENLLEKRTDLDYIIIEASGMADPGPVASIFWLDEALESRLRLDGIVTCVDAKNIQYQLKSTSSSDDDDGQHTGNNNEPGGGDEAARQIAFADRIIVNKVDLLQGTPEASIDEVLAEIKSINPTAPIKTTNYSKIEHLDWILDAKCFDSERAKDVESAFQQVVPVNDNTTMEGLLQNLNNLKNFHQHTSAVGTIALFGRGSVDLHKINAWLASILWPDQDESDKVLSARLHADLLTMKAEGKKANELSTRYTNANNEKGKQRIYRVKGILSVGHALDKEGKIIPDDWVDDETDIISINQETGLDQRRFIVQAVNDLWDVHPASQNLCWDDNETRCCKVVVIGRCLSESQLREGFRQCFNT